MVTGAISGHAKPIRCHYRLGVSAPHDHRKALHAGPRYPRRSVGPRALPTAKPYSWAVRDLACRQSRQLHCRAASGGAIRGVVALRGGGLPLHGHLARAVRTLCAARHNPHYAGAGCHWRAALPSVYARPFWHGTAGQLGLLVRPPHRPRRDQRAHVAARRAAPVSHVCKVAAAVRAPTRAAAAGEGTARLRAPLRSAPNAARSRSSGRGRSPVLLHDWLVLECCADHDLPPTGFAPSRPSVQLQLLRPVGGRAGDGSHGPRRPSPRATSRTE